MIYQDANVVNKHRTAPDDKMKRWVAHTIQLFNGCISFDGSVCIYATDNHSIRVAADGGNLRHCRLYESGSGRRATLGSHRCCKRKPSAPTRVQRNWKGPWRALDTHVSSFLFFFLYAYFSSSISSVRLSYRSCFFYSFWFLVLLLKIGEADKRGTMPCSRIDGLYLIWVTAGCHHFTIIPFTTLAVLCTVHTSAIGRLGFGHDKQLGFVAHSYAYIVSWSTGSQQWAF